MNNPFMKIKEFAAMLLAACLISAALVSCGTGKIPADAQTPTTADEISRGEYYPKSTPAKDPGDGVKIRYACEPAAAGTIIGTATQYIEKNGYAEPVTAAPFYGYTFTGWSDGTAERTRGGDQATEDKTYTARFEKVEGAIDLTVADVYLNTSSGRGVTSKTYTTGTLTITGSKDGMFDMTDRSLQVKGRGNSTWSTAYVDKIVGEERWSSTKRRYEEVSPIDLNASKNSFTIKFDEKVNLLGIGNGKNRDWILLSNKFDPTALRNKLVYMLAERMGTLTWVSHCTWVNLYVNGEYNGLYMVEEKVEASGDRINIDDSGTDPDKAYLVELDFRVDKDSSKTLDLDYFLVPEFHKNDANKREFDICSDHFTAEECAFIKNYLIEVDAAIRSNDKAKIEKYVDLASMVDMFIIEELVKDCDWGATSFYMYKEKGGILYFCSPWDFDLTMGPYSSSINITGIISAGTSGNEWYEQLHDVGWFVDMVCARMNALEDDLNIVLTEYYKYAQALKEYADRNNEHFGIYGKNFHEYVSPQVSGLLFTYDEHAGFVFDWVVYRWAEMRKYYPAHEKSPYEP